MDLLGKIGITESLIWMLFCLIIWMWILLFGGSIKVSLNKPWNKNKSE